MGAEVLGTKAMMQTDNMYPNTARLYAADFTGNADLPYDFFMSRYKEAYKQETLAFVDALVNDKPSPCSGEDGLVALDARRDLGALDPALLRGRLARRDG